MFPVIAPAAYREICNQIVSTATSEQDSLNKACLVAKAFVSMAELNYMSSFNIPDMCSKYLQLITLWFLLMSCFIIVLKDYIFKSPRIIFTLD